MVKVLLAIGTVLNTPDPEGKKAQWLPAQRVRFLGFIVDTELQRFVLPAEKRQDMVQLATSILQSSQVTNRQLAKLAGKMIAAAPAVQLSPMFARAVYKAMTEQQGWDMLYPSQQAALADIQCFLDTLSVTAGAKWWKRAKALLVAGDASEYAFAAYTPDGQFQHPVVVTFTRQELDLMAANQYSSKLREILCMLWVVKVILEQAPDLVTHSRLRYETDSQAGFYSVMGMKGNPSTFPVVKELRLLCAAHDVDLDVVWKPRGDPNQQLADTWSKVEDSADWSLNQAVYDQLITEPVLGGRIPAMDVFASSSNTKVPGSFYSRFLCPGTKGVDAMLQPWSYDADGSKLLLDINGPFHCMGQIIRRIRDEQVDCILLVPAGSRYWLAMLLALTTSMQSPAVRHTVDLSHIPNLLLPGPHACSKGVQRPSSFNVTAWYILW